MNSELMRILSKQTCSHVHVNNLYEIVQAKNDLAMIAMHCFSYGVMIGKQQERKRRRGEART